MKNTIIVIFILLAISCQQSDWGEIRYTHSTTNVMMEKSTSSTIVKTLQPNKKLKVVVLGEEWLLVYNSWETAKRNAIGYVHKSLLHKNPIIQEIEISD